MQISQKQSNKHIPVGERKFCYVTPCYVVCKPAGDYLIKGEEMKTKTRQDAQELGHQLYIVDELKKISKTLHAIDTGDCNGRDERSQRRADTRSDNLIKKAQGLAENIGYKVYHQGDPRGCSLYLITNDMIKTKTMTNDKTYQDIQYTQGIAIY